jgi:hypothetical protein
MKPLQIQAVAAILEGGAAAAREVAETTAKRTRTDTEATKEANVANFDIWRHSTASKETA